MNFGGVTANGKLRMLSSLSPTAYGSWVEARLKELLSAELFAEIDTVKIDHMWSIYKIVAMVRRKGRTEAFLLDCGFREIFEPRANRLVVEPAALARLILFLQ